MTVSVLSRVWRRLAGSTPKLCRYYIVMDDEGDWGPSGRTQDGAQLCDCVLGEYASDDEARYDFSTERIEQCVSEARSRQFSGRVRRLEIVKDLGAVFLLTPDWTERHQALVQRGARLVSVTAWNWDPGVGQMCGDPREGDPRLYAFPVDMLPRSRRSPESLES